MKVYIVYRLEKMSKIFWNFDMEFEMGIYYKSLYIKIGIFLEAQV